MSAGPSQAGTGQHLFKAEPCSTVWVCPPRSAPPFVDTWSAPTLGRCERCCRECGGPKTPSNPIFISFGSRLRVVSRAAAELFPVTTVWLYVGEGRSERRAWPGRPWSLRDPALSPCPLCSLRAQPCSTWATAPPPLSLHGLSPSSPALPPAHAVCAAGQHPGVWGSLRPERDTRPRGEV